MPSFLLYPPPPPPSLMVLKLWHARSWVHPPPPLSPIVYVFFCMFSLLHLEQPEHGLAVAVPHPCKPLQSSWLCPPGGVVRDSQVRGLYCGGEYSMRELFFRDGWEHFCGAGGGRWYLSHGKMSSSNWVLCRRSDLVTKVMYIFFLFSPVLGPLLYRIWSVWTTREKCAVVLLFFSFRQMKMLVCNLFDRSRRNCSDFSAGQLANSWRMVNSFRHRWTLIMDIGQQDGHR